jgi:hypothetical protein
MVGQGHPMTPAKKVATTKGKRPVGIPGDRYRVDQKGALYWVVDAKTGTVMAGPFRSRPNAQQRADQLERTVSQPRK